MITDKTIIITDDLEIIKKYNNNAIEIFNLDLLKKIYSEEFSFLKSNVSEYELYVNLSIINSIKNRMYEICKSKNYEIIIFYKKDISVDFVKWIDSIKNDYKNNFNVILHIKNQINKI